MTKQDFMSLRLIMLPLNQPVEGYRDLYDSTKDTWCSVWAKVNERFLIKGELFTDHLNRQDESATLYDGDKCAGILLFRTLDFAHFDYRHDSYFKDWTDNDVKQALSHGSRVFITSYMSVLPEYRNFSPHYKFKELLFNFMINRFLDSRADTILITARRDRGINDEGVARGGYILRDNVPFFDGLERVDFVAIPRATAKLSSNPAAREVAAYLWNHRLDLTYPKQKVLKVA